MERFPAVIMALITLCCIQSGAVSVRASEGKTVAIVELSAQTDADRKLSASLTEAMYEAASALPVDRYVLFAREHVKSLLAQKGIDPLSCTEPCHIHAGASIHADFVLGGTVRRTDGSVKVAIELVEVGPGRLLGIKSVSADDEKQLTEAFPKAAAELVEKLAAYDPGETEPAEQAGPPETEPAPPALAPVKKVRIRFTSRPAGVSVRVDGHRVCRRTPCFALIEVGEREIELRARHHHPRKEIVEIKGASHIRWHLTPYKYNYFGMHNLDDYGRLLTVGFLSDDEDFRAFTVISGSDFANLNPVADVGFGGDIFSYHRNEHGSHWGIFSFGPAIRIGRLIVESHLHVLSFRHRRTEPGVKTGWLPGISTRASIPLINNREWSGWAALVPVPTAGIDVWLDNDLNHDKTSYWVGFAWLTGFDFSHHSAFSFIEIDDE